MTSLLTWRKLTPLCVIFFNFCLSLHLLSRFCVDLQSVFTCPSLVSGSPPSFQGPLVFLPLCWLWSLYWSDQVLLCLLFAFRLSPLCRPFFLSLIKSSVCLHPGVSASCLLLAVVLLLSLSSSAFEEESSVLDCFHACTHFNIFPLLLLVY